MGCPTSIRCLKVVDYSNGVVVIMHQLAELVRQICNMDWSSVGQISLGWTAAQQQYGAFHGPIFTDDGSYISISCMPMWGVSNITHLGFSTVFRNSMVDTELILLRNWGHMLFPDASFSVCIVTAGVACLYLFTCIQECSYVPDSTGQGYHLC